MNPKTIIIILVVAILSATATYLVVKRQQGTVIVPPPPPPPVVMDTKKPKDKDSIKISFGVNAAGTALEIVSNNSDKCDASPKKGCFKVKKSKSGLIEFDFADAEQWKLTQFTICAGTTPITNACAVDLTLDEQLEFFVMDDSSGSTILLTPKSGQVDLAPLQGEANIATFWLFDQNTIDRAYYYNVTACPDAGGDCVHLDPPIENKGRG